MHRQGHLKPGRRKPKGSPAATGHKATGSNSLKSRTRKPHQRTGCHRQTSHKPKGSHGVTARKATGSNSPETRTNSKTPTSNRSKTGRPSRTDRNGLREKMEHRRLRNPGSQEAQGQTAPAETGPGLMVPGPRVAANALLQHLKLAHKQ